jgi:altronate hydrolase
MPTAYANPPATFEGIVRADGRVATRNYIGVLTSVNCSATAARAIADHFRRDIHPEALADFPNVDGVVALTHGMGCATDSEARAAGAAPHAGRLRAPRQLLPPCWWWAWAARPTRSRAWWRRRACSEGAWLVTFNIQDTGGTRQDRGARRRLIKQMLPDANRVQREPVPAATWWWACSAAAATATAASAPTRRWARRWTAWCATAAPPS